MSTMDTTAKAALEDSVLYPAFFVFLDVVGDPIRMTTYAGEVVPAGTGDADLDGRTYSSVDRRVLTVGSVTHSEEGSDTLAVSLSGMVTIDAQLLNEIGDNAKWRGRPARLWVRFYDMATGGWAGGFVPYYTGYMWGVDIDPSPESQTISLTIENYLATFNAPSNRTYLSQKEFDPNDTSAAASISSANGARTGGGYSSDASAIAPSRTNPILSSYRTNIQ